MITLRSFPDQCRSIPHCKDPSTNKLVIGIERRLFKIFDKKKEIAKLKARMGACPPDLLSLLRNIRQSSRAPTPNKIYFCEIL